MKLLLTGDWHLRSTTPAKRRDDFRATQRRKVERVLEIGREHQAPILQTGDIFDSEHPGLSTVNEYLELLRTYEHGFYSVPGNHDIYGADLGTLHRTAFKTLVAGGAVRVLDHEPVGLLNEAVCAVGHTYMHETKPTVPTGRRGYSTSEPALKVLVTHEMVLVDKLWREQEDFTYAGDYMKIHKGWDLVVCGHYHYQFSARVGDRVIVNPGALVRIKRSKGDMAMDPSVVLFDIETRALQWISLGAAPAADIFEPEPDGTLPVANPDLDSFVKALQPAVDEVDGAELRTGALADVAVSVLGETEVPLPVQALVKRYLAEAQEGA